jgi:hypothetical protein
MGMQGLRWIRIKRRKVRVGIDWTRPDYEKMDSITKRHERVDGQQTKNGTLLRAAEKFAGTRWKTISALIPGRTKNSVGSMPGSQHREDD